MIDIAAVAERDARKYFASLKVNRRSQERKRKLIKVYRIHETALRNGEKISCAKIGKRAGGIDQMDVYRMLKTVDRKSLHWTQSQAKIGLDLAYIIQAYDLGMTTYDIAFFAGCTQTNIWNRLQPHRRIERHRPIESFPAKRGGSVDLTYRLASEIYALRDAKLYEDEIADHLDIPEEMVEYAMNYKPLLSPQIAYVLMRFRQQKSNKPYHLNGHAA
jgi:hypothetical protein